MEFEEGHKISYSYDASGAKRRVVHTTVENIPSVAGERDKAGVVTSTTTDYAGGIVYEDGEIKQILTSEGYITPEKIFTASSVAKAGINIPQIIDTLVREDIIDAPIREDFNDNGGIIIGPKPKQPIPMRYHYFIKDYLGNVRSVIRCNEGSNTFSVVQYTNYYPFGMPWETSSGQEVQPYKREGKEYDEMYGLNMYDQGARLFGAELPRTMTIDPLAEKYYSTSPYAQWGNNPVKYTDPDGMKIDLSNMSQQERDQYLADMNLVRNESKLFYILYSFLEESENIYIIGFDSISMDGRFTPGKNGGNVSFKRGQRIGNNTILEEFFHAYQNENLSSYGDGEFNLEFEAKTFVVTAMTEGEMAGASVGDENQFLTDIQSYKYGKYSVTSPVAISLKGLSDYKSFLSGYVIGAKSFMENNIRNNIGNEEYRKNTTVMPFSLMKIIKQTHGK